MKIYTKTGDYGKTGVCDGARVSKASILMDCIGTIDEVNSSLGLAKTFSKNQIISNNIELLQHYLFDIGGELAGAGIKITDEDVIVIENLIDYHNEELEPLREVILPGGSKASSLLHHARTIVRRAERQLLRLNKVTETVNNSTLASMNRSSDLLVILSRVTNTSK